METKVCKANKCSSVGCTVQGGGGSLPLHSVRREDERENNVKCFSLQVTQPAESLVSIL